MDKAAYKKSVLELKQRLLNALAVTSMDWPDRLDPQSDMARQGGATLDSWQLRAVAEHLDEVLSLFGEVQKAIGLTMGLEPRFQPWLDGRCRGCGK